MKSLNELNPDQLNYLRYKWASEAKELECKIFRAQNKLNTLITKQSINNIFLNELWVAMDNGKMILEHLQTTGSPKNIIAVQEQIVVKSQNQYNKAASTLIVLTEEEAQLRQAGIDELVLFKSYRETKVLIIDNLLLALSKKTSISSDADASVSSITSFFKRSDRLVKKSPANSRSTKGLLAYSFIISSENLVALNGP